MYLKSLTLKGFKSFASATTLRFETGVTCVVGPNGSGKSNVVDAIAWVLGEQGAKTLRGGKMDDVIFAGTTGRAPLGRAEVTLTIDNSDNALPIDYTEVSITRRMFRDGASEYEINGASSRLLDVQELLSDSGIGREMHVIVGQGRLDSVLQARPEERRGFIEEAAGVLKHRKRKERALRKIDAMQANLNRLTDLTGELRRQLKPLGRQADVARRAATVQAELRDSRLRLLADDLVTLRAALAADLADEQAVRRRRDELELQLAANRSREAQLEQLRADAVPALARAQQTWYELGAVQERLRGTAQLAQERGRHLLDALNQQRAGRDPEALEAEAGRVRAEQHTLTTALSEAQDALDRCVDVRAQREQELAAAEHVVVVAARAVADRREGLARLIGQRDALRARISTGRDERQRLAEAAGRARERGLAAQRESAILESELAALDAGELDLDGQHESAAAAHQLAVELVLARAEARRALEAELSTWTARRDALAMGLQRKDGSAAVLAAGAAGAEEAPQQGGLAERIGPGEVLGSLAELITVESGFDAAVAGALGALADAVVVASSDTAAAAIMLLKTIDGGRAQLLVASGARGDVETVDGQPDAADGPTPIGRRNGAADGPGDALPPLPAGVHWASDVVSAAPSVAAGLRSALTAVAVVDDLAAAAELIRAYPTVRAVTRDGDLFAASAAAGGSASAPSLLEVHAAVDEATAHVDALSAQLRDVARQQIAQQADEEAKRADVERALAALNASDAQLSARAEQIAELGQAARAAAAEAERLDAAAVQSEQASARDDDSLAALEERLGAAKAAPVEDEPGTDVLDDLRAQLAQARSDEVEARLTVRSAQERVRSLTGRAESLERAATAERRERRHDEQLRAERRDVARVAAQVHEVAERALERVAVSLTASAARRDEHQRTQATLDAQLSDVRAAARDRAQALDELTDSVHRDEVLRAEQRLRIEQLESRAADEYGVEADALVAEYGPDQPVPPSAQERAEFEQARERGETVVAPGPGPFDRSAQDKRAARAERDLAQLGKVNPLALEEFAALEERHQFLATQLEDIKNTRRDLLSVVREVDDRILEVFSAAYADVAREFETVFATLFPGGSGRLLLTDPDDLLRTGIEVEARPPGKKVKRLSLLSGGERSLTAVALLVAIFRARPSPFYVLDEVEAALDDVNLGRLITLIGELRSGSQLIVITHQKRTMEIADALYGVTMRGDGISSVISSRIGRAAETTPAREPVPVSGT